MKHSLLIIIFFIFGLKMANACRCEYEMTIEDGLQSATIVFKGKVISKEITSSVKEFGAKLVGDTTSAVKFILKHPMAVYKIKVLSVYKGNAKSSILTIITDPTESGCGFKFKLNEDYIIYASNIDYRGSNRLTYKSENDKTFWTNHCTRTELFDDSEERYIKLYLKKIFAANKSIGEGRAGRRNFISRSMMNIGSNLSQFQFSFWNYK